MKLSQMNTRELAPVLASLAKPISDIATDDSTTEALQRIVNEKGNMNQVGAFIREIIPLLLDTHFESTCEIVAILTGKTAEEVKNQRGFQTIADAIDAFDEELLDFFKQSVHTEKKK